MGVSFQSRYPKASPASNRPHPGETGDLRTGTEEFLISWNPNSVGLLQYMQDIGAVPQPPGKW